ncbi:MAG: hypothetical protein M1355_00200 [Patescibacteria group bacterium]|nr:hypothetical protein [Patescibacteria group bacterium]
MKLSKQAINAYQQIHKEVFGETISEVDANESGLNLLNVIKIIHRPIPLNEMRENEKLHPNTK